MMISTINLYCTSHYTVEVCNGVRIVTGIAICAYVNRLSSLSELTLVFWCKEVRRLNYVIDYINKAIAEKL